MRIAFLNGAVSFGDYEQSMYYHTIVQGMIAAAFDMPASNMLLFLNAMVREGFAVKGDDGYHCTARLQELADASGGITIASITVQFPSFRYRESELEARGKEILGRIGRMMPIAGIESALPKTL